MLAGIFNFTVSATRYSYVKRSDENQTSAVAAKDRKLLDLEKYRLKLKLRDAGVEWHEDQKGKFKVWVRLAQHATSI